MLLVKWVKLDGLEDETLITILRQLRAGYPHHPHSFPQSIDLGLLKCPPTGGLVITNPIDQEIIPRVLAGGPQDSLSCICPSWLTAEETLNWLGISLLQIALIPQPLLPSRQSGEVGDRRYRPPWSQGCGGLYFRRHLCAITADPGGDGLCLSPVPDPLPISSASSLPVA